LQENAEFLAAEFEELNTLNQGLMEQQKQLIEKGSLREEEITKQFAAVRLIDEWLCLQLIF
jgi:hypothetical protein